MISKGSYSIPQKRIYKVASSAEPCGIARSARRAALLRISGELPIHKFAFDARKTDQDLDRNPRSNLQYYNRSQQYIDEEDQKRLESFARLIKPLEAIKDKFGSHPEYFHSYARKLHENVKSILKVRESDMDVFRPQMDYLEQLLYARYRISTEDLDKMGGDKLGEKILSKDEDLLKRGSFMHITGDQEGSEKQANLSIVKDGDKLSNDLIKTLFGSSRKDGEKTIERTVTITIRDSVIE